MDRDWEALVTRASCLQGSHVRAFQLTGVCHDRASLTAAPTDDRRHEASQHVAEYTEGPHPAVKNVSKYFDKSPDKLTFEDVRAYQLHLVSRGLQAATVIPIMCAVRFFYGTTLGRPNVAEHIPHVRQGKGRKNRDVMLSEQLLTILRSYRKAAHLVHLLFPGPDPKRPITVRSVQRACREAGPSRRPRRLGNRAHAAAQSVKSKAPSTSSVPS